MEVMQLFRGFQAVARKELKMSKRFEICDGAAELWYLTDNDDAGRTDDVTFPVLVSVHPMRKSAGM